MQYNLTDVLTGKTKTISKTFPLEADTVVIFGETHSLIKDSDVSLEASFIEEGKAGLKLKFDCKAMLPCDRCLKNVQRQISVNYEDVAFSADYKGDTEDGCEYMTGYKLDVDSLVISEIMMNWPSKILCKDDCKGICSVCGHNLNEGECGCDRFVPNPAFANLGDLFKNEK
jgi:uncharacterized protein